MLRSRAAIGTGRSDNEDLEAQFPFQNDKSALKSKRASVGMVRRQVRSIHYTWRLLPLTSKMIASIFVSFLILHVVLGTLDVWFHYYGLVVGDDDKSAAHSNQSTTRTFAVVINTYRRPQMLQEAVSHYADTCGLKFGVSQVFVVWADQETSPPDPSSSLLLQNASISEAQTKNRATVEILKVAKDSLNSRFQPIPQLTSDAIFMVDDDVRVSCPSLSLGFQAWTVNPEAMVGYYPRLASPPRSRITKEGEYVYHGWPTVFLQGSFNFVLTKASFLHKRYLAIYSDAIQHPQEILDHVDEHKNCEDVAMSLLVANYTRHEHGGTRPAAYPIYVEGSIRDKGLFGGISTGSGHMTTRSQCLTDLTRIYEKHGWGIPLSYTRTLQEQSWVHHYPGYWWQYRPSNFFEWFALGNIVS